MSIVSIAKLSKILTRKSDDFVSTYQSIRSKIFISEDRLAPNLYKCVLVGANRDLAMFIREHVTNRFMTRLDLIGRCSLTLHIKLNLVEVSGEPTGLCHMRHPGETKQKIIAQVNQS